MNDTPITTALHEKCMERDTSGYNDYLDMMALAIKFERELSEIEGEVHQHQLCDERTLKAMAEAERYKKALTDALQSLRNMKADTVKYPQLEICEHNAQRLDRTAAQIEQALNEQNKT